MKTTAEELSIQQILLGYLLWAGISIDCWGSTVQQIFTLLSKSGKVVTGMHSGNVGGQRPMVNQECWSCSTKHRGGMDDWQEPPASVTRANCFLLLVLGTNFSHHQRDQGMATWAQGLMSWPFSAPKLSLGTQRLRPENTGKVPRGAREDFIWSNWTLGTIIGSLRRGWGPV